MMYPYEDHTQGRAASAPVSRACACCNGPGCRGNFGHASRGERIRSADTAFFAPDTASQGGGHRQRNRRAAEVSGRRSARGRAGIDRHAAQRGGQGQPVFSARLQPRSRHRYRYHARRHAGQHAHPRARPGLCRSQFHDPRADQHPALQQGPLFPRSRRFRHRRRSADQLRGHAAPRPRTGDRRHARLLPRARRGLAPRGRRQPLGRGGICARQWTVDDPGQLQQGQPGAQL